MNRDSMGRNDRTIITGTAMDVAPICERLLTPMAAPASREKAIPAAMIPKKTAPSPGL